MGVLASQAATIVRKTALAYSISWIVIQKGIQHSMTRTARGYIGNEILNEEMY